MYNTKKKGEVNMTLKQFLKKEKMTIAKGAKFFKVNPSGFYAYVVRRAEPSIAKSLKIVALSKNKITIRELARIC